MNDIVMISKIKSELNNKKYNSPSGDIIIGLLLKFGYDEENILEILNFYMVERQPKDDLINKIVDDLKLFKKSEFSTKEIISITTKQPSIFIYEASKLQARYETIQKNVGLSNEQMKKVICNNPSILCQTSHRIIESINNFESKGFDKKELIKFLTLQPIALNHTKERVIQKIKNICNIGFSEEEVWYMIKRFPQLYSTDVNKIINRIEIFNG